MDKNDILGWTPRKDGAWILERTRRDTLEITEVATVEPVKDGLWKVTVAGQDPVVCTSLNDACEVAKSMARQVW